jgi:hypothetical protein
MDQQETRVASRIKHTTVIAHVRHHTLLLPPAPRGCLSGWVIEADELLQRAEGPSCSATIPAFP